MHFSYRKINEEKDLRRPQNDPTLLEKVMKKKLIGDRTNGSLFNFSSSTAAGFKITTIGKFGPTLECCNFVKYGPISILPEAFNWKSIIVLWCIHGSGHGHRELDIFRVFRGPFPGEPVEGTIVFLHQYMPCNSSFFMAYGK